MNRPHHDNGKLPPFQAEQSDTQIVVSFLELYPSAFNECVTSKLVDTFRRVSSNNQGYDLLTRTRSPLNRLTSR
ncbi:hypothetical protein PsorP6_014585 [Peronosclerospora sorghi]|uniref:Uncharacterized protein n=1 Tax=Peronosclerospora sorghi TaxID=230839 RepID=A0ACC0VT93_9STRA|nr:hypothetical protein PsorP6_014585 [Peronosclerospora sorghi]